jgi:GT2 family glycosyltransferase
VTERFPGVEVLANEANLGCAAAENQGICYALAQGADYVWLLNNDAFVDPGSLRELIRVAEGDRKIAVLGPAIYATERPDVEDNLGYRINLWTGRFRTVVSSEPGSGVDAAGVADLDSVQGCASLIRTTVFERVEPYYEPYEAYFEESDFHARVRRAGFRVVGVPSAKAWHKQAASYNRVILRRARLLLRNLVRFECRNAEKRHLAVFFPWFLLVHLPWFLVRGSLYALSHVAKKPTAARVAL